MSNSTHILVIDDDTRLRKLLHRYLQQEGYHVNVASNPAEARNLMSLFDFDLLVVDVMMPGETGLEFVRDIRQSNAVPVLMLTALGSAEERIEGLESGADDYLTKPFEPRELLLRISAILRRIATPTETSETGFHAIQFGPYIYHLDQQELLHNGKVVNLSPTEIGLLAALATLPDQVVPRDILAEKMDLIGNERTIDVQVTRLRRKIEDNPKNPQFLITLRGQGYRLRALPCAEMV